MPETTRALNDFQFLFTQDGGYLRIPIWGHIPLSRAARGVIEHPDFVRLQRIRQLSFVHYVFPGASHTRFEHSIGAYHLSVLMLQRLVLNPTNWLDSDTPGISPEDARVFLAASLLHDIGHYPFAHMIDRLPIMGGGLAFESHEDRARAHILEDRGPGSIYAILKDDWGIDDPASVVEVITRPMDSGLPGRMLSGILDPDKMDYLMRDAWACGVPYGSIDVDRLIESLVLDSDGSASRLGITEKGIAPLESLVFAKYMMFRHIYWHHAVRVAAAMFTRFVQDGLDSGLIRPSLFYSLPDDALIEQLADLPNMPSQELIASLRDRRLYKRGLTYYPDRAAEGEEFALSGSDLDRVKELHLRPDRRREKETAICDLLARDEGIELRGHEVLLDIPRITSVFDLEDFRGLRVLVRSQTGEESGFVSFHSHGFTLLTADFAQEFERYSRRVQVICRPDLRDAVTRRWKEIKSIVTGENV